MANRFGDLWLSCAGQPTKSQTRLHAAASQSDRTDRLHGSSPPYPNQPMSKAEKNPCHGAEDAVLRFSPLYTE